MSAPRPDFVANLILIYPYNVVLSVHRSSENSRLVKMKESILYHVHSFPTAPSPFLKSSARAIETGKLKQK